MSRAPTSRGLRHVVALASLALLIAGPDRLAAQPLAPGMLHARVECRDFPGQSYALYLPSGYTPDRAWPIVFCFDPAARGAVPVEHLLAAAEKLGFILAGSNNARNGPWLRSHAAADAMLRDTQIRFRIDRRLAFAAGFSGGARVACRVAEAGDFAGVIACGAGFSGAQPPEVVRFAFFGTAGREDFNYQEMRRTDTALAGRGTPHRLVIFEGAHAWMPPAVAERALEWLRLQAVRSGAAAPDDPWVRSVFDSRMREAASLRDEAQAWIEYTALVADFSGLVDTAEVARRAAELGRSRAVRRFLAEEKKAAAREERWFGRMGAAVTFLLDPAARDNARVGNDDGAGVWQRTPAAFPADEPMSGRDGAWSGDWEPTFRPGATPLDAPRTIEPAAPLRGLVRELQRAGRTDAAARRVLAATFTSLMESAREAMEGRDFPEAARRFEAATLVRREDPGAHYRLACARVALGDRKGARSSLDAAVAAGFADDARISELAALVDSNDPSVNELETFVVRDLPAIETSFGLALGVTADPDTRQILQLAVKRVARDSEAEARGLRPGAVILAADGRSVQTLVARFTRDSEFHRLFMGRRHGETIELQVLVRPGETPRTITLTQGRDAASADRPWMAETWKP